MMKLVKITVNMWNLTGNNLQIVQASVKINNLILKGVGWCLSIGDVFPHFHSE